MKLSNLLVIILLLNIDFVKPIKQNIIRRCHSMPIIRHTSQNILPLSILNKNITKKL